MCFEYENVTAPARQTARRSRPFLQSNVSTRGGRTTTTTTTPGAGPSSRSTQLCHSTSPPSATAASSQSSAVAATAADHGVTGEDHCVICMDEISQPRRLPCSHAFCSGCISKYFTRWQEKCPTCGKVIGVIRGNQPQPPGTFHKAIPSMSLPGYEGYKTMRITHTIPSCIQTREHPNPRKRFGGTVRLAFLPDSAEGSEVCTLPGQEFDA